MMEQAELVHCWEECQEKAAGRLGKHVQYLPKMYQMCKNKNLCVFWVTGKFCACERANYYFPQGLNSLE